MVVTYAVRNSVSILASFMTVYASLLPAATSVDEHRTAAQTENDGVGKPCSLPR